MTLPPALDPALAMLKAGRAGEALSFAEPFAALGLEPALTFTNELVEQLGLPPVHIDVTEVDPTDWTRPVLWAEVTDHLIKRLFMDDEWQTLEDGILSWWPWFLSQTFTLTHAGYYGGPHSAENRWMTVTSNIDIARLPEDAGVKLASDVNATFPLGAVVYEDGMLSMRGCLTLNNLCRNLLPWFHEAALAQATVAHDLALFLRDRGYEPSVSGHPASGLRDEPDELLSFFAGEYRAVPPGPELVSQIEASRTIYSHELVRLGYPQGWSNNEVDFITIVEDPLLDVAIIQPTDDPDNRRYGTGVGLWVRILPRGTAFAEEACNSANLDLLRWGGLTFLGNIRCDDRAQAWGSTYGTFITSGALEAGGQGNTDYVAMEVVNAVIHSVTPVKVMREILQREQEAGETGEL